MALYTVIIEKERDATLRREGLRASLDAASHIEPSLATFREVKIAGRRAYIHCHSTDTALYRAEEQLYISGSSVAGINGHCFTTDRQDATVRTAEYFAGLPRLQEIESLGGQFSFFSATSNGPLVAMSDQERLQSVYYLDSPEYFAISTRPAMLRSLVSTRRANLEMIGWIVASGFMVGDETTDSQVHAVPQGYYLEWKNGTHYLHERETAPWVQLAKRTQGKSVLDENSISAAIVAGASATQVSASNRAVRLPITGGKDSRLVLALCLAAGLKDRLTLFTNGEPTHPDVVAGGLIAERLGLKHEIVTPASNGGPPSRAVDRDLELLRLSAYQTDGQVGSWDRFNAGRIGAGTTMSGFLGESLKMFGGATEESLSLIEGVDEMVRLQEPFDPLEILNSTVRRRMLTTLEEKMTFYKSKGAEVRDLPNLFYFQNKHPNWLGQSLQVHTFSITNVMPFGVPQIVELGMGASVEERQMERAHYEIIKMAAPELLNIPFALKGWHPALRPEQITPVPASTKRNVRNYGSWQYFINDAKGSREDIDRIFQGAEDTALSDVVDIEKLRSRLKGPNFAYRELISLFGAISQSLYLAGDVRAKKLQNPAAKSSSAPSVETGYKLKTSTPVADAVVYPNKLATCNICEAVRTDGFLPGPDGRNLVRCPECSSLPRHRIVRLISRILKNTAGEFSRTFDLTPDAKSTSLLREEFGESHVGLNLEQLEIQTGEHLRTRLPFAKESVDFVLVSYMLERVHDDGEFLRELRRVLLPHACVLVQISPSPTKRTIQFAEGTEDERLQNLGSKDFLRRYGMDCDEYFASFGFAVQRFSPRDLLGDALVDSLKLTPSDPFWILRPENAYRGE